MPWKAKGKCVYLKSTGKKVGCTKGSVKKYLTALRMNAHEGKAPSFKAYHEGILGTLAGQQVNTDTQDSAATCEAEYAPGQEETMVVSDGADKDALIKDVINDIRDLLHVHDFNKPLDNDILQALGDTLKDAGVDPELFNRALGKDPSAVEELLVKAYHQLTALLQTRKVDEDESNPTFALPYGDQTAGISVTESFYEIGDIALSNPFGTGRKYFSGTSVPLEAKSPEDALNKFIQALIWKHRIPTNQRILFRDAQKNGVKIKEVAPPPPEPKKDYWWDKY